MVSFTSVFVELAHVGPTVSAFYRMFFGGIVLGALAVVRGNRLWYGLKSLGLPFLCALFFSLDLFMWHRSINYVGPGLATILANFQVFFVAVWAVIFLKERLNRRLLISIPFAVAGLFMIIRTDWLQPGVRVGLLFGLLAAVSYSFYILFLRKSQLIGQSKHTPIPNMAWICLIAAAMLGTAVVIEADASFAIPDLQSWLALLGLAVVGQGAGWVLISKGLPQVNASVAGLALLLQPALAFIWDILFFARPTTGLEYAGALIVLGAIYFGATKKE